MVFTSRLVTLALALTLADVTLAFGIPSDQLVRRVNVKARSIAGLMPSRSFRRSGIDDCIPCSNGIGCCIITRAVESSPTSDPNIFSVDDVARDSDDVDVSDDATSESDDATEDDSEVTDDGRTLPGVTADDSIDSGPSPSTTPESQSNNGAMRMNVERVALALPSIAIFYFSI
ncbi:hypothetical protein C8J56DRAFT_1048771 [Mycena floridula]|nr:hypothetical protein C8J56DRAFT_1048771 [Mycena floridula]